MFDLMYSSEQAKNMEHMMLHVTGGNIQRPRALYRVKKLKPMSFGLKTVALPCYPVAVAQIVMLEERA